MRRKARRRTFRRNSFPVAGAVVNPRRRRKVARRRRAFASNPVRRHRFTAKATRRRTFRRNPPDILGFNLKDIAYAGAAVVAAPFVEKQVMGMLPASLSGTKSGRWIVKIGSAAIIGMGAKKFLGRQAGNLALVALGANIIADAVSEFAPQLSMGYYTSSLGYYPAAQQLRGASPRMFPGPNDAVDSNVVDRLNPAMRF